MNNGDSNGSPASDTHSQRAATAQRAGAESTTHELLRPRAKVAHCPLRRRVISVGFQTPFSGGALSLSSKSSSKSGGAQRSLAQPYGAEARGSSLSSEERPEGEPGGGNGGELGHCEAEAEEAAEEAAEEEEEEERGEGPAALEWGEVHPEVVQRLDQVGQP